MNPYLFVTFFQVTQHTSWSWNGEGENLYKKQRSEKLVSPHEILLLDYFHAAFPSFTFSLPLPLQPKPVPISSFFYILIFHFLLSINIIIVIVIVIIPPYVCSLHSTHLQQQLQLQNSIPTYNSSNSIRFPNIGIMGRLITEINYIIGNTL